MIEPVELSRGGAYRAMVVLVTARLAQEAEGPRGLNECTIQIGETAARRSFYLRESAIGLKQT